MTQRQADVEGPRQFETKARPMGRPKAHLDKALRLAGELEDHEPFRPPNTSP